MSRITLTNIARDDLPKRGQDRGPDVYPFYDAALEQHYHKLVTPDFTRSRGIQPLRAFDTTEKSLRHCWVRPSITDFRPAPGQRKGWSWAKTIVVERDPEAFPSDQGLLDAEDLGDEVVTLLPEASAPLPAPPPTPLHNMPSLLRSLASASFIDDSPLPMPLGIEEYEMGSRTPSPPPPFLASAALAPPASEPIPSASPVSAPPALVPTSASTATSMASVSKPEITNIRVKVYRLKVPTGMKLLLRRWRESIRCLQNEAIRLVNQAERKSHPYLGAFGLIRLLGHNGSDFIKRHPFLKDTYAYSRRHVLVKAVANRKAIISNYSNLSASERLRKPMPTISPYTAERDRAQGWTVAFDKSTGSIEAEYDPFDASRVTGLKLVTSKSTIGRTEVSEYRLKICLRGQRQRQELLHLCKPSGKKRKLPREWFIRHEPTGRWYLHVCYKLTDNKTFKARQKAEKRRNGRTILEGPVRVKSIDPGARTPFTIYTSEGQAIDIGSETHRARLRRLRHSADRCQSQLNTLRSLNRRPSRHIGRGKRKRRFALPHPQRRRIAKQRRLIFDKSANLVKELHCRTAHFLAVSSDIIVMPRMEISAMVRRRRRGGLTKETKRELLGWSHYAFVNRLAIKCHDMAFDERFPHKKDRPPLLLVQPEAYTSKTCASCGRLNDRLGSSKRFKCPFQDCTYEADRDHNGAFNMVLKAIR